MNDVSVSSNFSLDGKHGFYNAIDITVNFTPYKLPWLDSEWDSGSVIGIRYTLRECIEEVIDRTPWKFIREANVKANAGTERVVESGRYRHPQFKLNVRYTSDAYAADNPQRFPLIDSDILWYLEFAFFIRAQDGTTIWDNNNGRNYVFPVTDMALTGSI